MTETIHGAPSRVLDRHPSMIAAPPPPLRMVHRTLLRAVRDAGEIDVDSLVRAVPHHARPLSALMTLVDAGLVEMDHSRAFHNGTRVRLATSP